MSQQHAQVAKKANGILAWVRNGEQHWKSSCPVLGTGEASPRVLCAVWGTSVQRGHGGAGAVQRRAARLGKGLENMAYEERLKQLGLFSLGRRRLRGDLIALFQYLKGDCSRAGPVCSHW